MKYLIETWFGLFVVDEDMEVIKKNLYDKDVEKLVDVNLDNSKIKNRFYDRFQELKKAPKEIEKKFKKEKWEKYYNKYRDLSKQFFNEFSDKKIKKGFEKKGESIIRSVNLLNDLDKSLNIFKENIEDFLSLFEELDDPEEVYKKYKNKKSLRTKEQALKKNSLLLIEFKKTRKNLVDYIKEEMKEFAPNLSNIAGGVLGAKLISLAGGLKKLATKPSGTIQVLGAEKALFRHLREGSEPPKHGIIFEHPYIRNTHWSKRGKIARALASKIAIAARIDYFSKEEKHEPLQKELEERVREVREN